MTSRLSSFILVILSGSLVACSKEQQPPRKEAPTGAASGQAKAAEHTDEPEHEELPSKVRLPPNVLAASGLKIGTVVAAVLAPSIDLTGEVAPDPDMLSVVTAQVPGRVVDVRFKEGQRVSVGTVLAVVESADLAKARATYSSAVARAEAAERNAKRLAALVNDGLASGQEASTAGAESTALQAEVNAARQALAAFGASALTPSSNASQLVLKAPLTGVVLSRDAVLGQTVGPDHVVARVVNLDKAYFVARLFEKNLAAITVGKRTDVRLNAYPDEVFAGTVESVGRQLDPTARTVVARIALKNRNDLLKLGLFGTARIVTDGEAKGERRLVVPLSAVTRLNDKEVVFVSHPDGDFEVHPVTLGASSGGLVEVIAGLREGEKVVIDGVFTLKSVVLKSTFGEEE